MFDYKEIRKLVRLLEQSQISEIEISVKDKSIRLAKNAPTDGQSAAAFAPSALPVPSPPAPETATPTAAQVSTGNQKVVKSPMVGTFYEAPSPDAEPYVQIGDIVRKGQVLCIVEAMKLMNEIESDSEGRIVEIHVENAQPVEFDHPLYTIEAV